MKLKILKYKYHEFITNKIGFIKSLILLGFYCKILKKV